METPGPDEAVVVRQQQIAASNTGLEQRTREFFFNLRKFTHRRERHKRPPGDNSEDAPAFSLEKEAPVV
jgi:hypothetical protein